MVDPWCVAGIGTASFLADAGHEIPTSLLPSLLTSTLGAPAAALGLIEGVSDALAGGARFAGGALADDPHRRRSVAIGGYTATAILSPRSHQPLGNLAASTIAGILWTAVSPTAAFTFLAAAMTIAVPLIATSQRDR